MSGNSKWNWLRIIAWVAYDICLMSSDEKKKLLCKWFDESKEEEEKRVGKEEKNLSSLLYTIFA